MPVIFEEVGSQSVEVAPDGGSEEIIFKVTGTDVRDEAIATAEGVNGLLATRPLSSNLFSGMTITNVIQKYSLQHLGAGMWQGRAQYGRRQPRLTGDVVPCFDCTGGTAHITTSKQTGSKWSASGETATPPDFGGAIGVNNDNVDGADVVVPVFKLTLDWFPPVSQMTPAFINALRLLTGTTNAAAWGGFDPGVLLFMGWTGQPRSFDDWALSLHFIGADSFETEQQTLTIGNIINVKKAAHDYIWIRYKQAESNSFGVKRPQFAYVERVYDSAAFDVIPVGDTPWIGINYG